MKKKTEIATNVSSGAEKVEEIEKQVKTSNPNKTESPNKVSVKKKVVKSDAGEQVNAKASNSSLNSEKAAKESEAAKARVKAALKKKEEKKKKKEERARKAQERKAQQVQKAKERKEARARLKEKRLQENKERAEKRKAQREEKMRERAHQKANARQKRNRAKSEKKSGKKENRQGYGGWLAAVISLGAVSLALGTVVTVGAIDMKNTKMAMSTGYRAMAYELSGIMENVDNDLDRVRVSASPMQQDRILTDLLVQVRLAELDMEKMPIAAESNQNFTTFLNRTGAECERMLAKLRGGERLSEEDNATIERLYQANHSIRQEISKMVSDLTDKDLSDYMKKGKGMISDVLQRIENTTLEENRLGMQNKEKPKTDGAGMGRKAPDLQSEGNKLDSLRAEELCRTYFADYNVKEFQCTGETTAKGYVAYNVQGYDNNGTLLFAEVDANSGALVGFDYYEPCNEENFDLDNAERIAEQFLERIGYEDMQITRVSESGTNADFTFVYQLNDVVFYPDAVHVKVCRSRGIVTGFDGSRFLKNHGDRIEPSTKISMGQAREKLRDGLTVEASRLAVVDTRQGERAAYEFLCEYQGEQYFIFLDANSGEEISIVNARDIR